jgi:hypothetical protein
MKTFLVVVPLLCLTACKTAAPVEQQLLDCGSAGAGTLLSSEVAIVEQDLASGTWNAQALLNQALTSAGPIVVCAVETVIQDLTSTGAALAPADEAKLIAAQSWLASEGHAALVAPPAAK